jgi:hypothetical protein
MDSLETRRRTTGEKPRLPSGLYARPNTDCAFGDFKLLTYAETIQEAGSSR